MLQITLIVLTGIVLLIVLGIIVYSPWQQKNKYSFPWLRKILSSKKNNSFQKEIQDQDEIMKLHKNTIQLAVKSRNLTRRTMSEIRDIFSHTIESNYEKTATLQLLSKIQNDFIALKEKIEKTRKMIASFATESHSNELEEIDKVNDKLIELLSDILKSIDLDNNYAEKHQVHNEAMKKNYDDIVLLHELLIDKFQKEFSTISV